MSRVRLSWSSPRVLVTGVGGLAVLVLLVRTAWMCDDAYITLRSVDNFVNGFGLRWNIAERVQSFTHPAWLILLTPFYAVTREGYFTSLGLQILLSISTVVLIGMVAARTAAWAGVAIAVYVSSKALVDFSTSGLENPLSHLLLVLFVLEWRVECARPRSLFRLGVLTSALLMCRLDFALLVAPFWAVAVRPLSWTRLRTAAIGAVPFIAWEAFSFVYYGQLIPNTALAKLPHGVSRSELAGQGMHYLQATWLFDPATVVILIAAAVFLSVWAGRSGRVAVLAMLLYLGYVVSIGGDFMVGRFLTAPLILGLVVAVSEGPSLSSRILAGVAAMLVFGGLAAPRAPIRSDSAFGVEALPPDQFAHFGVTDERRFYYPTLGLLRVLNGTAVPADHPWAAMGRTVRAQVQETDVRAASNIGLFGYFAGPKLDIVDRNGLSDPFLARLPPKPGWRTGHYTREVPDEYLESRRQNTNLLKDPDLRRLYDKVWWIHRADVWRVERFKIILGLSPVPERGP